MKTNCHSGILNRTVVIESLKNNDKNLMQNEAANDF